ncbi:hypothetical protein EDB84DRAFT_578632 [Lactarius hengduanensis]|nr:hypothetical protein EDB84DRAFT_578632 [Lactarius hengduanensis]
MFNLALREPDVDWLIRSETSRDEALGIEATGGWERCLLKQKPKPVPVFGPCDYITSAQSREDVCTPLEDPPNLDSGSGSFVPIVGSSFQSPYYFSDDTGSSDGTSDPRPTDSKTGVAAPPVIEPAPASSTAVPSAPEHTYPRIEPVHFPNLPPRTPEALTLLWCSNSATAGNAPAPEGVATISESPGPRVEMVRRPVQLVPAPWSLPPPTMPAPDRVGATSESTRPWVEMIHRPVQSVPAPWSRTSPTGSKPALAGSTSTPNTHPVSKSLAPLGNMSATEYTTLTSSSTHSQAAIVPRPVQVAHPTLSPSAFPVRRGPVPAGSVPAPNMGRLRSERARPHIGAGPTPTLLPRTPPDSLATPIVKIPAGSASGLNTKEISRPGIRTHPSDPLRTASVS